MKIDLKILCEVNKFASTGKDSRYYLRGVSVEGMGNSIRFVATDGCKLVVYNHMEPGFEGSFIIPSEFLDQFRFKKNEKLETEISVDTFTMSNSRGTFYFKPIDGTFPAWIRALPKMDEEIPAHYNPNHMYEFEKFSRNLFGNPAVLTQFGPKEAGLVTFGVDNCFGLTYPVERKPHQISGFW